MSDALNYFQEHQHKTNKLAKSLLKQVSRDLKIPYADVLKNFKLGNNYTITECFWQLYKQSNDKNQYNRVEFCMTCKKFTMKKVDDED